MSTELGIDPWGQTIIGDTCSKGYKTQKKVQVLKKMWFILKMTKHLGNNQKKKSGKIVGGIQRTQLASPEPDPAPREAEEMEGSQKPST